ncbi:CDF family Co(II)/Ni(II) efflux transporter DmeF [Verminephrobacter aporrectodeae]|uniref:CDF family Co(II)/Ni(II) efflux transporter DmeF n=1 Tax=Verminephrobacter aporrectodeae TaxID=1110389 RepID=UPI002243ECA8|nr:CDF family Co(II)/Ni(II) efflux transporter DmeF [Verminephrobacter aporrectodeae]
MASVSIQPAPPCTTMAGLGHDHGFGQGTRQRAETRTLVVAAITCLVMLVEVAAGLWTGSMALLADGIHMGGHAVALGLASAAYYLTRRHARDRRLSLGSGKINDLAAYTSALLLGLSTLWLVLESARRLFYAEPLQALEAMAVAAVGLVVNLLSVWLLAGVGRHYPDHAPGSPHAHHHAHDHAHGHGDHNLRAALLHVLADAATSVAAILGLLGAWLWGWRWLDPAIALVTSLVILRWSRGLLRQTISVLLDAQAPAELRTVVRERLESVAGGRVADLHLWSVGHDAWTLVASVVCHAPASPAMYKAALAGIDAIHHPTVEIHHCTACRSPGAHG